MGPREPKSRDGYRFVVSFIDDYSHTVFVYFLINQCDAVQETHSFLANTAPYRKINVSGLTMVQNLLYHQALLGKNWDYSSIAKLWNWHILFCWVYAYKVTVDQFIMPVNMTRENWTQGVRMELFSSMIRTAQTTWSIILTMGQTGEISDQNNCRAADTEWHDAWWQWLWDSKTRQNTDVSPGHTQRIWIYLARWVMSTDKHTVDYCDSFMCEVSLTITEAVMSSTMKEWVNMTDEEMQLLYMTYM